MDVDEIIPEGTESSGRSLRHSRRIAQLKIKEDAEQDKVEKPTKSESKSKHKKKTPKGKDDKEFKIDTKKQKGKPETEDESEDSGEDSKSSLKSKLLKKKKKENLRKLFNMNDTWKSSTDSSSHEEEEEEEVEEYISEDEPKEVLKSDHEFSPESDLENNDESQPTRRARTVKKESDTEEPADEHACQKCTKSDHPEWILLCDKCDCGWHCSCLRPALLVIPEGEWFCPPCQHIHLIEALKLELVEYDKKANRLEMEERRKERLAYVGISLDNVLPSKDQKKKQEDEPTVESSESSSSSESGSTSDDSDEPIYQLRQRRQAHSYRFNDYDELINSAIQVCITTLYLHLLSR